MKQQQRLRAPQQKSQCGERQQQKPAELRAAFAAKALRGWVGCNAFAVEHRRSPQGTVREAAERNGGSRALANKG
jgi:hypothetical protein